MPMRTQAVRFYLLVTLFAPLLVLALSTFAETGSRACSPNPREVGFLHIAWIDCRNNQDEVVIIVNGSGRDIDLTGYRITSAGGQEFLFQKTALNDNCCVIKAYDILRIHSGPKNDRPFDDPRDLYWLRKDGMPYRARVWNDDGDKAELIDKNGNVVDVYEY